MNEQIPFEKILKEALKEGVSMSTSSVEHTIPSSSEEDRIEKCLGLGDGGRSSNPL
jgi:hypothetical protein